MPLWMTAAQPKPWNSTDVPCALPVTTRMEPNISMSAASRFNPQWIDWANISVGDPGQAGLYCGGCQ